MRRALALSAAVLVGLSLASGTARAATADTTPPELRSVSASAGPHVPGTQVTWSFDIADESTITAIDLAYEVPGDEPGFFLVQLAPPAGWRSGALTWTIPGTATSAPHNGGYEVREVYLLDSAGTSSRYHRDGRLRTTPVGPTTHTIDIRSPLSIIDSPRDVTAPVLTSFSAPTSQEYGTISIPYVVEDATRRTVTLFGRRDGSEEVQLAWRPDAPPSGTLTFHPELVGNLDLTRVVVADANGNTTTYLSDGTFSSRSGGLTSPSGTHDLVIGRIRVLPTAARGVSVQPTSGAAVLTWTQLALAGHRVTINPGNTVVTGGPSAPDQQTRTIRLTGLRNGITHTVTVTPTSPAGDGVSSTGSVTPRMSMKVFGAGDQSGDGRSDLWATGFSDVTSDARWRLYTGAGGGRFGRTLTPSTMPGVYTGAPGSTTGRGPGAPFGALSRSGGELNEPKRSGGSYTIGTGFGVFRSIDASADLTSDGIADLIGITQTGDSYLYPGGEGTYAGTLGRGVRLGGGWAGFHAVFSPGDFNGDRHADVVGIDAQGSLWLYPGTGRGGFGPRTRIGSGWGGFGSVLPLRDFSGDGKVDIGAIAMDGALWMYPGNGRGGFLTKARIGTGWGMFL